MSQEEVMCRRAHDQTAPLQRHKNQWRKNGWDERERQYPKIT